MPKRSVTILSCDHCEESINMVDVQFIDAMVYGVVLHTRCYRVMTADQLLRVLALDAILVSRVKVALTGQYDPNSVKLIYYDKELI